MFDFCFYALITFIFSLFSVYIFLLCLEVTFVNITYLVSNLLSFTF